MRADRLSLLSLSLIAFGATGAYAQQSPPAPAAGLTLDRFLDRQTGRIMAADTDGDGRVSRAEMDAMPNKGGHDPSRRFDAMDGNHDGYLDKTEIQAALTARFRRMDRNGDGLVTPDERASARARGGQGQAGADAKPAPQTP